MESRSKPCSGICSNNGTVTETLGVSSSEHDLMTIPTEGGLMMEVGNLFQCSTTIAKKNYPLVR